MDTRTLLIFIGISALVLIAGLMIAFRHQARTRIDKRVEATITHIQVEASSLSSWWMVTAQQIIVNFNANEPKHYQMEL